MSEPSEKPKRNISSAYGLAYTCILPFLQQIAKDHGYCLAVHGSLHTDLDLLACPWVEDASDPEVLIEAIRQYVNGYFSGFKEVGNAWTKKPHGRLAYSILPKDVSNRFERLEYSPWLDISVMPKAPKAGE